jgi:phosphoenolpyruvate-protein phosphotransferase (PTS system enzyme I)
MNRDDLPGEDEQYAVFSALVRGMEGRPVTVRTFDLGLRNLSMAPRNIPRVKQRIRTLDMVAATRRARAIMDQSDSGRIAALLDDFNTVALAH